MTTITLLDPCAQLMLETVYMHHRHHVLMKVGHKKGCTCKWETEHLPSIPMCCCEALYCRERHNKFIDRPQLLSQSSIAPLLHLSHSSRLCSGIGPVGEMLKFYCHAKCLRWSRNFLGLRKAPSFSSSTQEIMGLLTLKLWFSRSFRTGAAIMRY